MTENKEAVVLLHGILKSNVDMALIARDLKREGYDVINLSYPSRHMPLRELSHFVRDKLKMSKKFNDASKVHFVTHSMGGLITRYYLHENRPPNLGRVVMLSPPNQGSDFANWMMGEKSLRKLYHDIFGPNASRRGGQLVSMLDKRATLRKIYNKVFGPAGKQLRTDHNHTVEPKVDFPLGVIAGNATVNPLAPWVLKNGENDGIVPVERMKIDGMKDMIILPTSHMFMVFNAQVRRQIVHFLKNERFDHPAPKL